MNFGGKIIYETLSDIVAGRRLIAQRGGTRSGKTYSILLCLSVLACKRCVAIDIVSESLPHLKRGAIHDFDEILQRENLPVDINKTDRTYTFQSGSVVRFFSADDWGKVKGSRRDIIFINEANRIEYETYRQLAVRTTGTIIIDWNPDSEFWYEKKGLSVDYPPHVSTYKDNPYLDAAQVAEIESNRDDVNWWNVYGLGQIGKIETLVFKNFDVVKKIPDGAKLVGYGLDFGFTIDPTALVAVYSSGGSVYLDEVIYSKGLTNDVISDKIKTLPTADIVADCAEMKSIQEIYNFGVRRIEPSKKGADSVKNGIDVMQRYDIKITADSLNVIDEFRQYKWKQDRITGEILNEPIDKFNHAIDAARYLITAKLSALPRNLGIKKIKIC